MIAAYAIAFVVIAAMILGTLIDYRTLKKISNGSRRERAAARMSALERDFAAARRRDRGTART